MQDTKEKINKDSIDAGNNDIVIPVIEEEVTIDKKLVEKGGIIISKTIGTDETVVEIPLTSEHLKIEHIQMNEFQESHPGIRYEGDTIVIPVVREVLVKKLLLVEEIRISKETSTEIHSENVSLRKDEITIKRKEK
jgi:uncharacterized protein (TIGR02271 family)